MERREQTGRIICREYKVAEKRTDREDSRQGRELTEKITGREENRQKR